MPGRPPPSAGGGGGAPLEAGCVGPPWPKTIILVRHGESAYNVHYEAHGTDPLDMWDAPLTQRGEAQARAAAAGLDAVGRVDLALASPLTRAVQTCLLALAPAERRAGRYEVSPLLAEHLEASCDVGRPPAELAADFHQLDFGHLSEVWWYVPEEERSGITPEGSRALFATNGRREPRCCAEQRADALAAGLARRAERTIALFGHADLFNLLLARHFSRSEARFADYWMRNCEVLPLSVTGPEELLQPVVVVTPEEPAPAPPPPPEEPVPAAAAPVAPPAAAASSGLAALKRRLAKEQPSLGPVDLQRETVRRWRELKPAERAALMTGALG